MSLWLLEVRKSLAGGLRSTLQTSMPPQTMASQLLQPQLLSSVLDIASLESCPKGGFSNASGPSWAILDRNTFASLVKRAVRNIECKPQMKCSLQNKRRNCCKNYSNAGLIKLRHLRNRSQHPCFRLASQNVSAASVSNPDTLPMLLLLFLPNLGFSGGGGKESCQVAVVAAEIHVLTTRVQ